MMETHSNQDEEHLNSLAIAHFVAGAVMMLFACLPLLYVGIGVAALAGEFPVSEENPEPMPEFLGWFFVAFGGAFFVIAQAVSISVVVSGRFLQKRKYYLFSFILACIQCTFFPIGTVLGVLTIIVLSRDSVKRAYGRLKSR